MSFKLGLREDAPPSAEAEAFVPFRLDSEYTYNGRDYGPASPKVPMKLALKAIYDRAKRVMIAEAAEAYGAGETGARLVTDADVPSFRETFGGRSEAELKQIVAEAISEQTGVTYTPDDVDAQTVTSTGEGFDLQPDASTGGLMPSVTPEPGRLPDGPAPAPPRPRPEVPPPPAAPAPAVPDGAPPAGDDTPDDDGADDGDDGPDDGADGAGADGAAGGEMQHPSGPIPADFPHAAVLAKAGVTTFEQLVQHGTHDNIDGVGVERWADITTAYDAAEAALNGDGE